MARTAVLRKQEKESIEILDFIFHIIIKKDDQPQTLDRVVLTDTQKSFFKERIADAASGTQYKFREKEFGVALRCKRILDDPTGAFVKESKGLATDFHDHHQSGNVSDGAFIVARFSIEKDGDNDQMTQMIAIIKMDHRRVLQYQISEEKGMVTARMSEILNSFVEDKVAVQKCAIVEVGDDYDWDVLAFERRNAEGVAQYFRAFLGADEADTPSNLTKNAVVAVNTWARASKENNLLSEEAREYKQRAIRYMEDRDTFDSDEFINHVIKEDDQEKKDSLVNSLSDMLQRKGVYGAVFSPKPDSIPDKYKKTKITTKEGVSVSWVGGHDAANVEVLDKDNNGMYTIKIRTQSYEED